ncbi:MAG TPA: hypothetical protein VH374_05450 [Polyangia bacterium]|nr:hypothetical protein [Polyangia bacterium]
MHGGSRVNSGPRRWSWLWQRPWQVLAGLGLLAGGCASLGGAPAPVLNQTDAARLSQSGQPTTVAELGQGRALFVARCASCHALPQPADYATDKWPRFVDEMAARAKLDGPEANAVLHYLLAARDVKVARR